MYVQFVILLKCGFPLSSDLNDSIIQSCSTCYSVAGDMLQGEAAVSSDLYMYTCNYTSI